MVFVHFVKQNYLDPNTFRLMRQNHYFSGMKIDRFKTKSSPFFRFLLFLIRCDSKGDGTYHLNALSALLVITLTITSCSQKEFNTETPYAIQAKEVRSYYKALDIQSRLKQKGVASYIVLEETADGNWYRVLSGAEKSIEDITSYKNEIEEGIPINFEIINFQKIEDKLILNFKDSLTERKRLKSKKPNVPEKIYELIDKFPEDRNFIVKSFFVSSSPDSIGDIRKYRAAYENINDDLPRGVSLKGLMKKSLCIAEVIYEDNLFGDRVTVDIIKLRENLDIEPTNTGVSRAQEIANYFAEIVLETGKYKFEDKLQIEVSSFQKFSGYKVTIQPKKNKDVLRTYFILVSKDLNFLVFLQSTDKTDDEIIQIIEELGQSEGLGSYDEFYNAFYTLPALCTINDKFVSISSEMLTNRYARDRGYKKWAKKMVGHWVTTANFNGVINNNWALSFFDVLNEDKVNFIYNDLYIKSNKSSRNRDIIEMLGVKGVIDRDKYPRELSFPKNRFVVAINNTNYGRLNRKKMLTLAECLQLN